MVDGTRSLLQYMVKDKFLATSANTKTSCHATVSKDSAISVGRLKFLRDSGRPTIQRHILCIVLGGALCRRSMCIFGNFIDMRRVQPSIDASRKSSLGSLGSCASWNWIASSM